MARLALNKSSLSREQNQLKAFERFLPSLDLKRRQLIAERAKAVQTLKETQQEIDTRTRSIGEQLPMLSNEGVKLEKLVTVSDAKLSEENIVGTRLPLLDSIEVEVCDYALMGNPAWVDAVVEQLRAILELRVRLQVEERRLELLLASVKIITQRVNLFDKVLIPRARKNMKRIRIYLSDAERAGVINSKLAKSKRAKEAVAV